MEQLERAGRDPYVRNLLKTFGDITNEQIGKLENRLAVETHILRRFIAASIVLNHASIKYLQAYLASEPPPPTSEIEERRKTFGESFFQTSIDEAEKRYLSRVLREREQLLDMLLNDSRISDLMDSSFHPNSKRTPEAENQPPTPTTKSK